jgi:hypothetical protein
MPPPVGKNATDLLGRSAKEKRHYLGPEHIFDFPSLIIDNPVASKKRINLVDLNVDIYGLNEIQGSLLPIGVIVRRTRLTRLPP